MQSITINLPPYSESDYWLPFIVNGTSLLIYKDVIGRHINGRHPIQPPPSYRDDVESEYQMIIYPHVSSAQYLNYLCFTQRLEPEEIANRLLDAFLKSFRENTAFRLYRTEQDSSESMVFDPNLSIKPVEVTYFRASEAQSSDKGIDTQNFVAYWFYVLHFNITPRSS